MCTKEGNTATTAETGTTPHTTTIGCFHPWQAIPQALWRATGTIEGTLLL